MHQKKNISLKKKTECTKMELGTLLKLTWVCSFSTLSLYCKSINQTYSSPREWQLLAIMGAQLKDLLKSLKRHSSMTLRGLRRALTCSPIIPRYASLSVFFSVRPQGLQNSRIEFPNVTDGCGIWKFRTYIFNWILNTRF